MLDLLTMMSIAVASQKGDIPKDCSLGWKLQIPPIISQAVLKLIYYHNWFTGELFESESEDREITCTFAVYWWYLNANTLMPILHVTLLVFKCLVTSMGTSLNQMKHHEHFVNHRYGVVWLLPSKWLAKSMAAPIQMAGQINGKNMETH